MHELHPHPDNTGFVLCWLKMKQDENAENQERSIQARGNQLNDAAMAKNGDIPSIPQFQCPEVVIAESSKKIYGKSDRSYQNGTKFLAPIHEDNHHFSPNQVHVMSTKNSSSTANASGSFLAVSEPSNQELNFPHPFLDVDVGTAIEAEEEHTNQRKAGLVQPLEKEDEMSRTSNFIGEQADNYCDRMDCENPEQFPFAEHQVQEVQNQLYELIMNGSSSSYCDLFPNGELFDKYGLISDPETEIGVSQYLQLGQTSSDNLWTNRNRRPVCDTLEGAIPFEEEKGFVEQKFNHPHDTEKIITECTSSDGAPAKVKAADFKEKDATMIQPQKKKDDVKIESDNIYRWETWNDSLSPTRLTASTSSFCRNISTIDPGVLLAILIALVLLVYVIVLGICRISDGINETIQHYVFYRRF